MSEIKRYYYSNGQLERETPYNDEGQRHGIEKKWHGNGQLWRKIPYKNGKGHGFARWWSDNGDLSTEHYLLYNTIVSKEEYIKHILIEKLACLK